MMPNPIFDKVQKVQMSNNPINMILNKMKEFKQGFDQNADPMELAQKYIKNNNLNSSQLNYIKRSAKQAVDAGIVTNDDYNKFAQMLSNK